MVCGTVRPAREAAVHSWDFSRLRPEQWEWRIVRDAEPGASDAAGACLRQWDFAARDVDAQGWQIPAIAQRRTSQGARIETRSNEVTLTLVCDETVVSAGEVNAVRCTVGIGRQPHEAGEMHAVSPLGPPILHWGTREDVENGLGTLFKGGKTRNSWLRSTDASGNHTYEWDTQGHALWEGNLAAFRISFSLPRALAPDELPYVVTLRDIQLLQMAPSTCDTTPRATSDGIRLALRTQAVGLQLRGCKVDSRTCDTIRIAFSVHRALGQNGNRTAISVTTTPVVYWASPSDSKSNTWPFDAEHMALFAPVNVVNPQDWEAAPYVNWNGIVSDFWIRIPLPKALGAEEPPYQVTIKSVGFLHTGAGRAPTPWWVIGGMSLLASIAWVALRWSYRRRRQRRNGFDTGAVRGPVRARELLLFALFCIAFKCFFLFLDSHPIVHGDSPSYVAVSRAITTTPSARPPGYSVLLWLIRSISGTGTLHAVVVSQTAIGIATAVLMLWFLRRGLGLSRKPAWLLASLVVLSPVNLALERAILSETSSLFLFATLLICAYFVFQDPTCIRMLALVVLASALPEFRHSYIFIPLGISMLLLLRACFAERGERAIWVASSLLLWMATSFGSALLGSLSVQDQEPNCALTGRIFDSGSGLSFGYWHTWCRWSSVAEKHDLDKYEWGPILLGDIDDLHKGGQTFRTDSATNRFLQACRMTESQRRKVFKTACIEMMKRHPFQVASLIGGCMWEWANGTPARPPTDRLKLDAASARVVAEMAPDAAPLLGASKNEWSFVPMMTRPSAVWSRFRGVHLLALGFLAVVSVLRLRDRFPMFALASLALMYFLSVNVSGILVERYFQPVELAGVVSLGCLVSIWQTRWAAGRHVADR